jgi:hypothetical protein
MNGLISMDRIRTLIRENIGEAAVLYAVYVSANVLFIIDWNLVVGSILAVIGFAYLIVCFEEVEKIKRGE